jgi:hypothetical protein
LRGRGADNNPDREKALVVSPSLHRAPTLFTAQINSEHGRKAYLNATCRFAEWCDVRRVGKLADVQAYHVAAFLKDQVSQPT